MDIFRSYLQRFICIFCASFLLVGCSYFDTGAPVTTAGAPAGPQVSTYNPYDFKAAVYQKTQGAVELYDLDGGMDAPATPSQEVAVPAAEAAPVQADPVSQNRYESEYNALLSGEMSQEFQPVSTFRDEDGSASSSNSGSSVEIFPFEPYQGSMMAPPPVSSPASSYSGPLTPPPSLQPAAMMEQPPPQPARKEEFVSVSGAGQPVIVYFEHDTADLNGEGLSKVRSVANAFNVAAGRGLTVEGHSSVMANYADEAQRKVVNLKVSMDRAFVVARALIQSGVPADFIRVMAWGDTMPPQSLDGKSAEEAARRVEISGQ